MDGDYVTVKEFASAVGAPLPTVRHRIARGEIPIFRDPCDHRRRLIRREDLEAALRPIPIVVSKRFTKEEEAKNVGT